MNIHDRMERVSWVLLEDKNEGTRFTEIQDALDWSTSTVNNVLREMAERGFIFPRENGPVRLTPKFYEEVLEEPELYAPTT